MPRVRYPAVPWRGAAKGANVTLIPRRAPKPYRHFVIRLRVNHGNVLGGARCRVQVRSVM
jgi:hypothetical protein